MDIGLSKQQSESRKFSLLKSTFLTLVNIYTDYRNEQIDNLAFSKGEIFSAQTKKNLISEGRAFVEFELPIQTLLYVAGKLEKDITKYKSAPFGSDDVNGAELHSKLNQWAMSQSRGFRKIATAGMHSAIAKEGVVNIRWNFDKGEGEPDLTAVDPTLVMFDPDPGDDRFVVYYPMMSCEEIIATCKKYLTDEQITEMRNTARQLEGEHVGDKPTGYIERGISSLKQKWNANFGGTARSSTYDPFFDASSGLYRFIELHDERTEIHKFVYSPLTGENEEIPEELHNDTDFHNEKFQELNIDGSVRFPDGRIEEVTVNKIWVTTIVPALLPDRLLFEEPHPVQERGFQFKRISCFSWHPDKLGVRSIMDTIKPATLFYNQMLATALGLTQKGINPNITYPKGAITTPDQITAWNDKSQGIHREYNLLPGINSKPEEERVPVETIKLLETMRDEGRAMMEYIASVSPNAKGFQESSSESGTLFNARKAATEIMIGYFLSQVNEASREIYLYTDKLMQVFMTQPRELRLLNDKGDIEWLKINMEALNGLKDNSVAEGDFDFVPDPSATGESARREKVFMWGQMLPAAQRFDELVLYILGIIAKNIDDTEGMKFAELTDMMLQRTLGMRDQQMQVQQQGVQMQQVAQKMALMGKAKELVTPPTNGKNKK